MDAGMSESELRAFGRTLAGVTAEVADQASGAPEAAWGDTFFYYDPDDDPADRRFPFATIVASNYPGFDEASDLDRDGVYRLNIAVGRDAYTDLLGHAPTDHAARSAEFDYAEFDTVLPHPIYAAQGWVSIVNPGERTLDLAHQLMSDARDLAAKRHDRRAAP
jgi:hypothetical protein